MRESLLQTWREVQLPAIRTDLAGRRAPGLPATRTVFLAVDGAARKHILVQIDEQQQSLESRDTRGLQCVTEVARIGDNPENRFIDIVCLDPSQDRLFATLAEDLIESLARGPSPENQVVRQILSRWKTFWTAKSGTFTFEQALGLFGELWFLYRWLGSANHSKWMVMPAARHDFQWSEASVEVKTALAASVATASHHIASIDQLDVPSTGDLYLFSLLVLEDPLSANTLESLVATLSRELQEDPIAMSSFRQKLATYGFVPSSSPFSNRPLRIVREALYTVRDDFPRIIRQSFPGGVPGGVGNINYLLALGACDQWQIAARPTDPAAAFLQHGD